jgi:[ribosomal protein S5]-alanine N-acetyltransferase
MRAAGGRSQSSRIRRATRSVGSGSPSAERATRLLCSWALTTDTGIERIQATVEPWNLASQRVLEKVGFVREGLLRSYASWGDERQDVYLYSLLRSDLAESDA